MDSNSHRVAKIRRAEARVVLAAMALCRAGRGFCYTDERKISDQKIGQRLERACAYLKKVRTT